MLSLPQLPSEYHQILIIEAESRRYRLLAGGIAVALALLMLIPASLAVPLRTMFVTDQWWSVLPKFLLIAAEVLFCAYLREAMTALFMWRLGHSAPRFTFSFPLFIAQSNSWFCRRHYFIISILPITVVAVLLGAISCIVPFSWFWVIYAAQIVNISGMSAVLYTAARLSKAPADLLINDDGCQLIVCTRKPD